jgi:hypothetical protein
LRVERGRCATHSMPPSLTMELVGRSIHASAMATTYPSVLGRTEDYSWKEAADHSCPAR